MHAPPAIMQRKNERGRTVVDGHRTNDGDQCSLVVMHEHVGGCLTLYPHGDGKLGMRLSEAEALKMAQAILNGAR